MSVLEETGKNKNMVDAEIEKIKEMVELRKKWEYNKYINLRTYWKKESFWIHLANTVFLLIKDHV